jgi:hypothetical protein
VSFLDEPRVSHLGYEDGLGIVHRQIIPAYHPDGYLFCPNCGGKTEERADDETNSLPDWWDCRGCGATGAFMHGRWPGVTRNGHPLLGYSRLF